MASFLLAERGYPNRYYAWMQDGRPHYTTKAHAARLKEEVAKQVKSQLVQLGFDEPKIVPDS